MERPDGAGDALAGELEERTWNDYAYEETLTVQRGPVRGRVDGELAVLTIEEFAISVSSSRRSEHFAIAPVARHDFAHAPWWSCSRRMTWSDCVATNVTVLGSGRRCRVAPTVGRRRATLQQSCTP